MDFQLTEVDKKVLSFVSRGVNKAAAIEKISEFFQLKQPIVQETIARLKMHGLIIESQRVAGVSVYMTSPLKVKSTMIDQQVVDQLAKIEKGTKASGFKHHTFNVDTGEIEDAGKKKEKKKDSGLGFDIL